MATETITMCDSCGKACNCINASNNARLILACALVPGPSCTPAALWDLCDACATAVQNLVKQYVSQRDKSRPSPKLMHAHVTAYDSHGRPFGYTEEATKAMKLLESMVEAGVVALAPDKWSNGQSRFMRPHLVETNKP